MLRSVIRSRSLATLLVMAVLAACQDTIGPPDSAGPQFAQGGQLGGIVVSPKMLKFGTVDCSGSTDAACVRSAYLTNTTPVSLAFSSDETTTPWFFDEGLTDNPDGCTFIRTSGQYLAPGASCILYIAFNPDLSVSGRISDTYTTTWTDGSRLFQAAVRLMATEL